MRNVSLDHRRMQEKWKTQIQKFSPRTPPNEGVLASAYWFKKSPASLFLKLGISACERYKQPQNLAGLDCSGAQWIIMVALGQGAFYF